jgi:class 3 adenylate cyclase
MHAAVEGLGVRIRAGLHTGEVELVGGNARGLAIHAAARIVGLAGPGETLVSWTTHDLLDGSAFVFEARGLRQLKGLSGPRAVFSVVS